MTNKPRTSGQGNGIRGMGVDARGGPVVDPTANVVALNEAANKRQDDLRDSERRFFESEVEHVKEMAALRAGYQQQLSEAEAKRIDAIRAVDVNAVAVASERQAAAAQVLANQVAQSADALRTLVSTTAAAMAEQQRQQMTQITDRLTLVERSQYEGRGKQLVADPQMERLSALVEQLASKQATGAGKEAATDPVMTKALSNIEVLLMTQAQGAGKSQGAQWAIGAGIGAAGVLIALAVLVTKFLN